MRHRDEDAGGVGEEPVTRSAPRIPAAADSPAASPEAGALPFAFRITGIQALPSAVAGRRRLSSPSGRARSSARPPRSSSSQRPPAPARRLAVSQWIEADAAAVRVAAARPRGQRSRSRCSSTWRACSRTSHRCRRRCTRGCASHGRRSPRRSCRRWSSRPPPHRPWRWCSTTYSAWTNRGAGPRRGPSSRLCRTARRSSCAAAPIRRSRWRGCAPKGSSRSSASRSWPSTPARSRSCVRLRGVEPRRRSSWRTCSGPPRGGPRGCISASRPWAPERRTRG